MATISASLYTSTDHCTVTERPATTLRSDDLANSPVSSPFQRMRRPVPMFGGKSSLRISASGKEPALVVVIRVTGRVPSIVRLIDVSSFSPHRGPILQGQSHYGVAPHKRVLHPSNDSFHVATSGAASVVSMVMSVLLVTYCSSL